MISITNFFSLCCPMTIQCQYSSLHPHCLELCLLLQITKNSVLAHLSLRKHSLLLFNTSWLTLLPAGGGGLDSATTCWTSGNPAQFSIIDIDSSSLFGYGPSLSGSVSLSMTTTCFTGGRGVEEIAGRKHPEGIVCWWVLGFTS